MAWHQFFRVDPGFDGGGTTVSVVARAPEHLDLFAAGANKGIYSAYWDSATGWSTFFRIDGGFSKAANAVTAVARDPQHLDLFVAGIDGRVYSAYWADATGWSGFFAVDRGFTHATGTVTAISRTPDHLDLFVAGSDGIVHTVYWDAATGWATFSAIDPGFVLAAAAPTVVARSTDHLDLFVTGSDGAVHNAYWDAAVGWSFFSRIDSGFTLAATDVAAIARTPDHIDLFVTGSDGKVHSAYWDVASGWSFFSAIYPQFVLARSSIAVLARSPSHLDIFVTGTDDRVYTTAWDAASGWAEWFPIDDGFTIGRSSVSAVARQPDVMDLFIADTSGGVHSVFWDPLPGILRKVSITFDTHDEDKDDSTLVRVFLRNRRPDSRTPTAQTDFVSNWLALPRYQPGGDLVTGHRNPYLAYGFNLGQGDPFGDDPPTSHTLDLELTSDGIGVDDVELPEVSIHMLADGDDRWIFDYIVTLTFDSGRFSFSSKTNGVAGIILDQDHRSHVGIGIENPLRTRPIPVADEPPTGALLKKVTLAFNTHSDDRDPDTRLNVHIVNRRLGDAEQDLALGLDLFHNQGFPAGEDAGDAYRKFSWAADEGTLISNTVPLADMVLPMVYIVIAPNGDDRWTFDYRMTFEFEDPADFGPKRRVYSSQINGVTLDQNNPKHAGVYQGEPFPTVAPPTAPTLSFQPVDHTGAQRKQISIAFLNRKFDELINSRNGTDTEPNPPMFRVHLGSTGPPFWPLPESYSDVQSLVNGEFGFVQRVSSPAGLGQIKKAWGLADSFLENINSAQIRLAIDSSPVTPLTFEAVFAPGGTLHNDIFGEITLDQLSVTLRLTLDKAVLVNAFGVTHTVVDLMSWVSELANMSTVVVQPTTIPATFRYTGTFLHQPVDLVSPYTMNNLFLEQVVQVQLNTDSSWDPGETIRQTIRDTIFDKLRKVDVLSGLSVRDTFNSLATTWLLGGVGDDPLNTDENNTVLHDVEIRRADPEAGVAEDMLVLDYSGPRNVFVPPTPADWPQPGHPNPGHDFSPGHLANIDHIVVLTKENRSFDHMLGYLRLPLAQGGMGRQDIDGLTGNQVNSYLGTDYRPFPLDDTRFAPGPPNGYESVHRAIGGGAMDGFVSSHAEANRDDVAGRVMGYHTGKTVPVFDALARDFAIGHRWFCSHPGPTFPNRFYELTGRPNLDARGFWEFENSSPIRPVFTPTIFDYLNGATDPRTGVQVSWRYFETAYCTLRFFEGYTFDHEHIVGFDDPEEGFFALARSGQLPNVSFIDPHFVDYPPGSNCDEPPSDVWDGQALVQRVVNAVVSGPAWNKTLLLIVYDEHGGFYDHVPPPAAAPLSPEFAIATLGLRVPVFIVSPWVTPGSVFGDDALYFDHTSILKTIARRFMSDKPPYMGVRYAAANDLSQVIGNQLQQPQFLPFITYRLQFTRSHNLLTAVQLPDALAVLWHTPVDGTTPQDFAFEDAGSGYVFIRSKVGNAYVAAQTPDSVTVVQTAATAGTRWKFRRLVSRRWIVICSSSPIRSFRPWCYVRPLSREGR